MTGVSAARVGRTPLVELDLDVDATVYGKAEWFNGGTTAHGGGSVKTRIGLAMLQAAETVDGLAPPETVIEASSGNTGAAVARFGAARGYDVEIVAPTSAGAGKVAAMRDAGATVRFVDEEAGYDAFVAECREVVDAAPDEYYHPDQYRNPANPGVHAGTTGPEIWRQTDGEVTAFVAGAGTGGTVVGVGSALGDRGVDVHAFEPARADHDVPGLKFMDSPEAFVPRTFQPGVVDTMDALATETAHEYARRLRHRHGDEIPIRDPGQWSVSAVRERLRVDGEFLVGPSSAAAAAMVERLADRGAVGPEDVVVIPLPDRGDRYPERDIWRDLG
ncbi:MAG: PLP-dependent cysteine synthase family protein [Halobacterium sp.]